MKIYDQSDIILLNMTKGSVIMRVEALYRQKDSTMITLERDITNSGYTKSIINGKEYDFKMNPDIESFLYTLNRSRD